MDVGNELFGRQQEVATVWERISQATRGRGTITVVEGPAGIGKTRLAMSAVELAVRNNIVVARGAGYELERQRAFGPLLDALDIRSANSDPLAREIYQLLDQAGSDEDGPGGQIRFRVAERLVDMLEARATHHGMVLWLDDLQWGDSATFVALSRFVDIITEAPISLLVTHRPVERGHELELLLSKAEPISRVVQLDPLATKAVDELAAHVLGGPPDAALRSAIDGAGGNPFFISQFLSALQEEGLLKQTQRGVESLSSAPPTTFRVTALRRLAFIPSETLNVLRMASILGTRFKLRDLAVASGLEELEIADLLDRLLTSGVLDATDNGYRFAHDLIREALYDDIAPARRGVMHRLVAARLMQAGETAVKAAPHLVLGAEPGDLEAVGYLVEAAEGIKSREPEEAVALLEKAAVLADDVSEAKRIRSKMVQPLIWLGRLSEAEKGARSAIASFGASPDYVSQLAMALFLQDRQQETRKVLEDALSAVGLDEQNRCRLMARAAFFEYTDLPRAHELAIEALELARSQGDVESEGLALMTLTNFQDDLDVSIEMARSVLRMADTREGRVLAGYHPHLTLAHIHLYAGQMDAAEEALEAGKRLGELTGTVWHHHQYAILQACISFLKGDWERTISEAQMGTEAARKTDVSHQVQASLSLIAGVAARRGDIAAATALVSGREPTEDQPWADRHAYLLVQMLIADGTGDKEAAVVAGNELWDLLERGTRRQAVFSGFDILITLLRNGAPGQAQRIAKDFDGLRTVLPGQMGEALIVGARALMSTDIDEALRAAASLATASLPWEAAHVYLHAADLAASAKDQTVVEMAVARATPMLEQMGAEPAIRRAEAILRDVGLRKGSRRPRMKATSGWASITRGERAVLDLLAQGATNREIADRLFISKRTVESHVGSLFRKLEVKSRVELAARALKRAAGANDSVQQSDQL